MNTLIVVDVQNDFLEGGAFGVNGADAEYVEKINRMVSLFNGIVQGQIIFTGDSHPADHSSFSIFPPHCVKGTDGEKIAVKGEGLLLLKGEDKDVEEFSAFRNGKNIDLIEGERIYIAGLAGDYCVRETINDIVKYAPKKKVLLFCDLIKSVNGRPVRDYYGFANKVTFIEESEILWKENKNQK